MFRPETFLLNTGPPGYIIRLIFYGGGNMLNKRNLVLLLGVLIFSAGFLSASTPLAFALKFKSHNSYLVYDVDEDTLQIIALGRVISYGDGWEVKRIKSYLYELKAPDWQSFFWKVNTSRKQAWRVEGVAFGELGGNHEDLACSVEVVGSPSSPKRFILRFTEGSRTALIYHLRRGTVKLMAEGDPVMLHNWQVRRLKSYLYHLRHKNWRSFFWKVNTSRRQAWEVQGGRFGELGGEDHPLACKVLLYYSSSSGKPPALPGRIRRPWGRRVRVPVTFKTMMIYFPSITITHLVSRPVLQIAVGNKVVSYGGDWEVRRVYPYLFHLRQKNWKNFFWAVNTSRRKAWEVRNGDFGRIGGDYSRPFNCQVKVRGDRNNPEAFSLVFPSSAKPRLIYDGKSLQIAVGSTVLSYGKNWRVVKAGLNVYHFRHRMWKNFFWEVHLLSGRVFEVRNGQFGTPGQGQKKELDFEVRLLK